MNANELGEAILAATFSTTIAKTKTFELKMADFPVNAILAMLAHGAQRKFNDAVGGKERNGEEYTAEMKVADAAALIEDFKKGVVSKRREGGGTDVRTSIARSVMRSLVPNLLSKDDVKKFRAMEAAEQNTKLDGWIAANAKAIEPMIDAEIVRREKEAEKKAKLATGLAVTL
jgi:hypothetical protein